MHRTNTDTHRGTYHAGLARTRWRAEVGRALLGGAPAGTMTAVPEPASARERYCSPSCRRPRSGCSRSSLVTAVDAST
eukprot:2837277-Rhodomonas_salina.1